MRRLLALALTAASPAVLATPLRAAAALPPIKHVWVVILENKSYDDAFVNNTNSYLWTTLPSRGVLLDQYYGTGHFSLDNYISLMSGQAPNGDTQADCQVYQDVTPGITGMDGQATGQGCVYPDTVKTLVDQLEAKGLTWKGYMEDMGNTPGREPATCGNPPLDSRDGTQSATAADQYAARHNPFVYFHSILDPPGRCAAHVTALPPLADDVASIATTPNFSFITPNLCDDGHDATPCAGENVDGTNEGGLVAADKWLAKYVPVITDSPAFKQDGLLMITLDESGQAGTAAGSTACCNEPAGLSGMPGMVGPGGGRIGTVMLSPFIEPGTRSSVPYNHYSALRSFEDLFGIGEHLGYANAAGLVPFGDDVYNRPPDGTTGGAGPTGDTGASGGSGTSGATEAGGSTSTTSTTTPPPGSSTSTTTSPPGSTTVATTGPPPSSTATTSPPPSGSTATTSPPPAGSATTSPPPSGSTATTSPPPAGSATTSPPPSDTATTAGPAASTSDGLPAAAPVGSPPVDDMVPGHGVVPPLPPLSPHDAGSTGRAIPLSIGLRTGVPSRLRLSTLRRRLAVRGGLPLRVHLRGTDRLTIAVQAVLKRGSTVVATTPEVSTLKDAKGVLRLVPTAGVTLAPGRYRLVVYGKQEHQVVVRRVRHYAVR